MMKLLANEAADTRPRFSLRNFLRTSVHREALRVQRPLRSALPFLASSLTLGALAILLALYTPCYSLSVNGVPVGLVINHEVVDQTFTQVEGQVSRILERDYSMSLGLDYDLTVATKDDLISYSRLSDSIYAAVPDIKQAYVLSVDGNYLGAAEDKSVLDAALATIQSPYMSETTKEVFFANEARITRKYIPTENAFSEGAQFVSAMKQSVTANTVYEVKKGDTLGSVAAHFDMSKAALRELNPNLSKKSGLIEGQVITAQKTLPRLSVCTVDELAYTRTLASPVQERKDNTLYEGDRKVITQGIEGSESIQSKMTYVNGETQYEEILSQEVLTQPTETVVAVGTKERPAYYSTGSLQWPCPGNVTSPFGYRNIFGGTSFHSGMDIANSYGTAISAADSGIVTFVGYKGTYGNLVIIDHGNGWETCYSHSSSMSVSVGQGVAKGEVIAKMGATGRATGNHCHFEVRVNGEAVNPMGYLS